MAALKSDSAETLVRLGFMLPCEEFCRVGPDPLLKLWVVHEAFGHTLVTSVDKHAPVDSASLCVSSALGCVFNQEAAAGPAHTAFWGASRRQPRSSASR